MKIVNSMLFVVTVFLISGCIREPISKNKGSIVNAKGNTEVISGTLSILLWDSYHRKRVNSLLKPNSKFISNLVVTDDNKRGQLYVINFLSSDKQVVEKLFDEIKKTNFYSDINIKPIFKVKLLVEKEPIPEWGTSSGRGTPRNPYIPTHAIKLKKIESLKMSLNPIPSNCFELAMPCR